MSIRLCGGLGVNDADYQVTTYIVSQGKRKRVWICPYYARWKCLMERLGPYNTQVAYIGRSCCEDWTYFSKFKGWMESQIWEGLHLDKDILKPGNKVYSPETCAFVPHWINTLFMTNTHRKGDYPLGVALSYKGLYRAQVSSVLTNTNVHLGMHVDPFSAHKAWQEGKIGQIKQAVKIYQQESCFREDVMIAILSRVDVLKEDLKNNRETIDFI